MRFEGQGAELLAIYDGRQERPNGEVLPAGALLYRFLPAPAGQDYVDELAEGTPATRADIEEWRDYTLVLSNECRANAAGPDTTPTPSVEMALRSAP